MSRGLAPPLRRRERLGCAALAGALQVVALSPRGFGWVAWGALIPLFVALAGATRGAAILVTIVYTVVFGVVGLEPWFARATAAYFGIGIGPMVALTLPALVLLCSAHGALLGVLLAGRPPRVGPRDVLWCGALWVCWEAVRMAVLPYYPAAVLGLSQHATLPVLQTASLCGIAGVTFVLVAFNAALASLLVHSPAGRAARAAAAATGIALAGSAAGWGALRLARTPAEPSVGPRIVAVDVNARSWSESTLDRYLAASEPGAASRPTLLLWPESALTVDIEREPGVWNTLSRFVATHGTPLLAGGLGSALRTGGAVAHFNSAHLVTVDHGLRSYHKRGLVAFAERWPAILGQPPSDLTSLDAGPDTTVFALDDTAFGVLICFEITDSAGARALARGGARFIVNLTNDVWFLGSARPPHLPWAAIRAVETGVPVVRAANAGVSAVFDRFGRQVAASRPSDRPTLLMARVPPAAPTVYARTGDAFLAACAVVVLLGILRAFATARQPRRARPT